MIRIWGDFNELDRERRVRLYTPERNRDLRKLGGQLVDGLHVIVDSGDYEAEGVLEFSEGMWRARILWESAKDKTDSKPAHGHSQ